MRVSDVFRRALDGNQEDSSWPPPCRRTYPCGGGRCRSGSHAPSLQPRSGSHKPMGKHLQRWGAVYLLLALFLGSWAGQFFAQVQEVSDEARNHGEAFTWPEFWPKFWK